MKPVMHLLGADVRRFRLLLAVWIPSLIAYTIVRAVAPVLASDPRLATTTELLMTLLFAIRWLGLVVIVPLVVQAHPLVGSNAFWMTRPIPWRLLLVSKYVLLWSTLAGIPAVCEYVLVVACRMPHEMAAGVAMQTLLSQSLWVAMLFALATMTRDLPRFAMAAGGILVALVLVLNVVLAVAMRNRFDGPQLTPIDVRSRDAGISAIAFVVLLIAAAVAQHVVQYRTRMVHASLGAGIACGAVAILAMTYWPSHAIPLPVPMWAAQEPAVHIAAQSARGEFQLSEPGPSQHPGQTWMSGAVHARVSGVQKGWIATGRLADSTLQFGDATTLTTAGNGYYFPLWLESVDDDPTRFAELQALGVSRLLGATVRPAMDSVVAIVIREADFSRRLGAASTFHGRYVLDLDHVELAGTLPLRVGAEFQDRHRRIVIDQVLPQPLGATLQLRQYSGGSTSNSDIVPRLTLYLRNRAAGEAIGTSVNSGIGMRSIGLNVPMFFGFAMSGPGPGFDVTDDFVRFGEPSQADYQLPPSWLSSAELAILYAVPAGSVRRTLEIPGFEIAAAPPTPVR